MKLDEYIAQRKAELEAFKKYWHEQHIKNPDNWPMEMGAGDWWEHELATKFSEVP